MNSSIVHILMGNGMVGYLTKYNITFSGTIVGPHNTYLELLLALGIMGSIVFIMYIVIIYRCQKLKTHTIEHTIYSYLPAVAFLIFIFTLQSLVKYNTYFFINMIFMNMFYDGE